MKEDIINESNSDVEYGECCNNILMKSYPDKDGCLEFMSLEAEGEAAGSRVALTCAACGCHQNFHKRREEKREISYKPNSHNGSCARMYDSDDYCD